MPVTLNGTNGLTFNDGSSQATSPFVGGLGFRNRIINGDMRIDQRNNGASVSVGPSIVSLLYTLDRWAGFASSTRTFTVQRSSVAPAGFINSALLTVGVSGAPSASEQIFFSQSIEGLNIADFGWGTADAQPIAVSFWVRSSITGTYSVAVVNSGGSRSYLTTYTINVANTWEQKTVTIPGDTSGTWLTTNGIGLNLRFDLGSGSTYNGTANTWTGSFVWRTSGSVNWIANAGATFYITGVQLEKGSTATSFDYRPYGTELILCQRYFRALKSGLIGFWASATAARLQCTWLGMRATPSFTQSGTLTITDNSVNATQSSVSVTDNGSDADGGQLILGNLSGATANRVAAVLAASAGSIFVSAEL